MDPTIWIGDRTAEALLEREGELARLASALDAAAAGAGSALLIEAEAGIGKSTLLDWARAQATERSMRVLAGCGTDLEADLAFGVIRQCLEPALAGMSQDDVDQLSAGAAALALPVLIEAPAAETDASFGAFYGLYWLLAALCERAPVLLALDDVHWADEASLRFLAYLVRRAQSLPLVVVAALRPLAPSDRPAAVVASLRADPAVDVLVPGALREASVGELLGDGCDPAFARACHEATGGNPFLLARLARALREDGVPFTAESADRVRALAPPEVTRAVTGALARLGPEVADVARAVGVLGDDVALDLVCALCGLTPAQGLAAASELERAGLLVADVRVRFRHPLLRAAAVGAVPALERAAWHRKAAALLRARGAPAEQVAAHLLSAGATAEAGDLDTLREAGQRALARGAPAAAVPLLRRAAEVSPSIEVGFDVLLALASAERAAGQISEALDHLRAALAVAADPARRARALVAWGRTCGADPEANRELAALIAGALDGEALPDRELALRLKASYLLAIYLAHQRDDPRARVLERDLSRLGGDTPGEAIALSALIDPEAPDATAAELGTLAVRVTRHADELLSEGARDGRAHNLLIALRWSDQLDAAERLTDRWIEIARRQGSAEAFAAASINRSNLERIRGRLTRSEEDAAAAIAVSMPGEFSFVMGKTALADCLLYKGHVAAAQAAFDDIGFAAEIPQQRPYMGALIVRAQLRAASGQLPAALEDFHEVHRRSRGGNGGWAAAWFAFAECAHRLGDRELAAAVLKRGFMAAQRWGTDSALGAALRRRGR